MKKTVFPIMYLALAVIFLNGAALAQIEPGTWTHIVPQKPQYELSAVFSGPEGALCAGIATAFHILKNDAWQRYEIGSPLLGNHIPFHYGSDGSLYFIDNGDIVIWRDGVINRIDTEIGLNVAAVFAPDGKLYIASFNSTTGGLFVLDNGVVTRLREGRTKSVAVGPDGAVWATVYDSENSRMILIRFNGSSWEDMSDNVKSLYPVTTREMMVTAAPDGSIWVSNRGKYSIYRDGEWSYKNGGGAPVSIKFISDGSIWGYGNNSVYRLNEYGDWIEKYVTGIRAPEASTAIAEFGDGAVCIFDGNELYKYNGQRFTLFKSPDDIGSAMIVCMAYDSNDVLVCGHGRWDILPEYRKDEGLSYRDESGWHNTRDKDKLDFINVYDLKRTPEGDVMSFTDGGFKLLSPGGWSLLDSLYNFNNETDMGWYNNSMWITTTRGLVEYIDHPEYEFYFPLDGEDVYTLDNLTVRDNGVLYMQVPLRDIVTFNGNEWITMVDDDGMTNDFGVDDDGTIWAARELELAYRNIPEFRWVHVCDLVAGSVIEIDDNDRVWFAGYGKLGYYEDGEVYTVPEFGDYACDVIAFSDEGNVAVNLFDRFREEFDGLLEYTPTTSVQKTKERPEKFLLSRSYPNPFNPMTTIAFNLPESSFARLEVYSLTGQKIADIPERHCPQGWNTFRWTAGDDVSSGIYFYRVIAGERMATGKIMLLK